MTNKINYLVLLTVAFQLFSCNDNTKTSKVEVKDTVEIKKEEPIKPPTINILDTISVGKIVVCMKDSSATIEGVGQKLGAIYGQISKEIIAKNKLSTTGQPMAWYKNEKAPYFFEAGIPVSKAPAKLGKDMYIKEVKTDSATIAHFFGPYNLLSQGYTAIKERLKDSKRSANGVPYEIYVGDPIDTTGKPIDPYKVRTDIVFPWK
ncbi:MAG: hypothetical protein KA319_10705 [Ferruginibacter sp.]|nr:hypothetical protein [Ferruginibacter sp.]